MNATTTLIPIISVLLGGGFVGALVTVYKARPERDQLVVNSAQNAATVMRGLNDALYMDLSRARAERDEWEAKADAYESALRSAGISLPRVEKPQLSEPEPRS